MPTPSEIRKLQRLVNDQGIPDLPTHRGQTLHRFDVRKLAAALEQEVQVCRLMDWSKVSLHMDLDDALTLAALLKRVRL